MPWKFYSLKYFPIKAATNQLTIQIYDYFEIYKCHFQGYEQCRQQMQVHAVKLMVISRHQSWGEWGRDPRFWSGWVGIFFTQAVGKHESKSQLLGLLATGKTSVIMAERSDMIKKVIIKFVLPCTIRFRSF